MLYMDLFVYIIKYVYYEKYLYLLTATFITYYIILLCYVILSILSVTLTIYTPVMSYGCIIGQVVIVDKYIIRHFKMSL